MKTSPLRTAIGLLGPAFVAAIAYVDPGNFATNLSAGSQLGYSLLWVLVVANLMASLVQYLSAKLGLVTGRSLPEIIRDKLNTKARIAYWLQAELAAIATDIAEVMGGAIALQLLFNLPLIVGGIITGLVSLVLLVLQEKRSQRTFERVTLGFLLIIPIGFIGSLIIKPPQIDSVIGGLIPSLNGETSILLATGILGATIMPHVVYLHSALVRDRRGKVPESRLNTLIKATRIDIGIAMFIASLINIAMFLMAASTLSGIPGITTLNDVYNSIGVIIGPNTSTLFAIGLLASGLASTSVGCYAGSVIMSGLLHRQSSVFTRRLITVLPSIAIIASGLDPTKVLILSQVVLSFAIPFAVIPLVKLTADKQLMGIRVNHPATSIVAWTITALITSLNGYLIFITLSQ